MDGTAPTASSSVYAGPFLADNKEISAVSVLNGKTGSVYKEQLGYVKKDWKVVNAGSETVDHKAQLAFDENPATYWQTEKAAADQSLTIDMGCVKSIKGFAYTPQKANQEGMFERGTIWVSMDNRKWEKADDFVFGNLINDPVKRYHYFKSEVKGRYVKIEMVESANKSEYASIAELDIL